MCEAPYSPKINSRSRNAKNGLQATTTTAGRTPKNHGNSRKPLFADYVRYITEQGNLMRSKSQNQKSISRQRLSSGQTVSVSAKDADENSSQQFEKQFAVIAPTAIHQDGLEKQR